MASSLESRRMLKDFLVDHELPSCSSRNDLKKSWNPRKPCNKLIRARRSSRILLSHSKAASVSISAGVHRASDMVMNAMKFFPYIATTIKTTTATTTPTINNYLPRRISRKLACISRKRSMQVLDDHPVVSVNYKVVKIKDILRWKSFRDINAMEMEEIMPSSSSSSSVEFSCSPNQYNSSTTAAAAPTTITTAGSRRSSTDSTTSSKRSSRGSGSDDFTVDEDLSACCSEDKDWSCMNEDGLEFSSKHYLRQCPDQGTTVSENRELEFNEGDQQSPVSVLDSPFQEDEAFSFFFKRNLASMERRKCRLMQRIEEFESFRYKNLERSSDQLSADEGGHEKHITINGGGDAAVRERAVQLLSRVKGTAENSDEHSNNESQVLLDYFIQELTTTSTSVINGGGSSSGKLGDDGKMLRFAESWLSNNSYKEEEKEERCINGGGYCWEWEIMEKGLKDSWNFSSSSSSCCFEEEERGLGCKMEMMVLNDLVDEILSDLLSIK